MTAFVEGTQFEVISCGVCHIKFALTVEMHRARLDDHKSLWCPNGDRVSYSGKTEAQKLKDELVRAGEVLAAEQARAAKVRRERDEVARSHKRMRTRVMNGVCPCCNRTFQNLLNHMRTEHKGEFNLRNLREAYGMTQAQLATEIGVHAIYISLQEREKSVPVWAQHNIEAWVESQDKVKP